MRVAPRVLVTLAGDCEPEDDGEPGDLGHSIRESHLAALLGAGLVPVLVTGTMPEPVVRELAAGCACAYLPGTDYVPNRAEEAEAESRLNADRAGLPWDPAKVRADLAAIALAWERRLPLLGVCGGMQAMVVAAGGALRAASPDEVERHARRPDAEPLDLAPGTLAAGVFGGEATANSFHRQLVATAPPALVVAGRAADGIVEAIEAPPGAHPFWLGLQWHPERLGDTRPYAALARAAFYARPRP